MPTSLATCGLAISRDGTRMYYGIEASIVVFDIAKKKQLDRIDIGENVGCINLSDDEATLFAGSRSGTGRVIDLLTRKTLILPSQERSLCCILPCEETDVLTSTSECIRRWNRSTGEFIRTYSCDSDLATRGSIVISIIYDKRTKRIFSAMTNGVIIVWDAETSRVTGEMKSNPNQFIAIAWATPTTIVTCAADNTAKYWDITTLTCIQTILVENTLFAVASSPDGQRVAAGSFDNSVKIWDLATGIENAVLSHHSDTVAQVIFSPDGRFIASNAYDDILNLYHIEPPFPFLIKDGSLTSAQTKSHHLLYSDGTFRSSYDTPSPVRITTSTRCTLSTENSFTLKLDHPSTNSSMITLTATSMASAQEWVEAICAVTNNIAFRPANRLGTPSDIICRYRFDILQQISFHHRRTTQHPLAVKDVMKIIGMYVTTQASKAGFR